MAESVDRRVVILEALTVELERQGVVGADADALAEAVNKALGGWERPDFDELSREPDELNATNDG